jgi:hypothetical protein
MKKLPLESCERLLVESVVFNVKQVEQLEQLGLGQITLFVLDVRRNSRDEFLNSLVHVT